MPEYSLYMHMNPDQNCHRNQKTVITNKGIKEVMKKTKHTKKIILFFLLIFALTAVRLDYVFYYNTNLAKSIIV